MWTCVVRCPSVTCSCRCVECILYGVYQQYTDPPPPPPLSRLLPISHPQVNVDCLDKSNIDQILVSYMVCADSTPVQLSYEPARSFNRRGSGTGSNNVHPPQTQAQAQAQVREFLYDVCSVCCMQCIALSGFLANHAPHTHPALPPARLVDDTDHAEQHVHVGRGQR